MYILGISAFYHDSAAALIYNGEIIAAAQEERFTRKKNDSRFPKNAIKYCFETANITPKQIDHIAFYDKPFIKFERLLETYIALAPRGFKSFRTAIPIWLKEKLFLKDLLIKELNNFEQENDWDKKLKFSEHHLSHAASAFFPSPFKKAAVLTLDGVGEWATTSLAIGNENILEVVKEIHFPHSIGLLYSAFTYYIGFEVNSGEYKVMGLAPYGKPHYMNKIFDQLIDLKPDGSFRLNQSYFNYCTGLSMTNKKFDDLFGGKPRNPSDPLTERHMDLAASIQAATELILLRLARSISKETGLENLCLAGGVALNCVANGKILREGRFNNIWIQPAAGDAGGALGAALATYHIHLKQSRHITHHDKMLGSYLGPEFNQDEIEKRLEAIGANFITLTDKELFSMCAKDIANQKAVGWFQGRMEFGPRALGARSILADPRSTSMQYKLNLKIKFRESFRPFAPSILREDLTEWFKLNIDSPYMLLVTDVTDSHKRKITDEDEKLSGIKKLSVIRSDIPAVTHVDNSSRIQTVNKNTNPRYYALIEAFKKETGCPILVNTSFNVRDEPIVCTPEDAFKCFMDTNIETLAIGNCYLRKDSQNKPHRKKVKIQSN
jgi:carbamoyltransferase